MVGATLLAGALACGLAACNNNAGPAASSTKRVDSVVAAAPDTIRPISLDSIRKR
jgi:hypothetical protein